LTSLTDHLKYEVPIGHLGGGGLTGSYINTHMQTLHKQKTYNATYSEKYIKMYGNPREWHVPV